MKESIKKRLSEILKEPRFGSYQSVPELSIDGMRTNHRGRLKEYGVFELIKDKSVLDIGCNIGQMTLECAKTARYVCGIDPVLEYIQAALILKDFYDRQNVDFRNITFLNHIPGSESKYDVILAFAVHNWVECNLVDFFKHLRELLVGHGTVIFESHRGRNIKKLSRQIQSAGFDTEKRKCSTERRFALRCIKI